MVIFGMLDTEDNQGKRPLRWLVGVG